MDNFPKATIVLSNHCNLSCSYCFVKQNNRKHLSIGRIKTFIKWFVEQAPKDKPIKLNFFGGEPFLEFDLLKESILFFKNLLAEKEYAIDTIPTNGTILTEKMLDFVRRECLRVSFSLDGAKISNLARRFKNNTSCFDRVWNNMNKFQNYVKYSPMIKLTVLPSNVNNLFSNIKFLFENGFNYLWPNPCVFTAKWEKDMVNTFINEYKKILRFYLAKKLSGDVLKIVPLDDILEKSAMGALQERDFFCGLGEEPILSPKGDIYACDSVLLNNAKLTSRFKVGRVTRTRVDIDLTKINLFQKYNLYEHHDLKNKNHFLSGLFRRRPCFTLDSKGKILKKNYIENILDLHLNIFELSLKLFTKYRGLLK